MKEFYETKLIAKVEELERVQKHLLEQFAILKTKYYVELEEVKEIVSKLTK